MQRTISIVGLVIFSLCLTACSKTFPVSGNIPRTKEKFLGTATSQMVGKSAINITTDDGVKCSGEYIAPLVSSPDEGATGDGKFLCSDGRTGTFTFTGDTVSGEGFGNMDNGDKFDFTYGKSRIVKIR